MEDELSMKRKPDIVQRAGIGEEEPDMGLKRIQREADPEEELAMKRIQREGDDVDMMGSFDVGGNIEQQIASSSGGGGAITGETKSFMESSFGEDFSSVKVHTGSESSDLNRSLGAKAFTHGQFNPGSSGGQELLAHELTHTVQQTGSKPIQQKREEQ
jgi:hypothetical protein